MICHYVENKDSKTPNDHIQHKQQGAKFAQLLFVFHQYTTSVLTHGLARRFSDDVASGMLIRLLFMLPCRFGDCIAERYRYHRLHGPQRGEAKVWRVRFDNSVFESRVTFSIA